MHVGDAGAAGALTGSPDTAGTFSSTTPGSVALPQDFVSTSMALGEELWFKAASGKTGVLIGEQNAALTGSPTHWAPMLWVGTDGKLRGQIWFATSPNIGPMASTARVDDGQWHHVVLSASVDHQELYLDHVLIGSVTGRTIGHVDMRYAFVGNGRTASNWPGTPAAAGNFPFGGQIDDVAFYRHPMTQAEVDAHWNARTGSIRMNSVVEPWAVGIASPITGSTGKCLDIVNSGTTDGTAVQMYTCNGTGAQSWTWQADGTVRGLGKCLDVAGGATANGSNWSSGPATERRARSGRARRPACGARPPVGALTSPPPTRPTERGR